jgi:hypothetical protein
VQSTRNTSLTATSITEVINRMAATNLTSGSPDPVPSSREYVVRICDDCYALKGEMCHVPECVFCRRTMQEVRDYLDAMLIRPIVDGEPLDLHPLSEDPEPDRSALLERVEWLETQLGLAYDYITHGKLSKPYAFKSVQADIDDAITEHVNEAMKEERELSADVSHEMGEPIGQLVYEDGSPLSKPETDNSRRDVSFAWSPGVTVELGGDVSPTIQNRDAVDVGAIVEKHVQRYQWGDDTLHGAIRSAVDEALAARK